MNGDYHPYIGCVNASSSFLQKHYYTSVKGYTSMDLDFLEQLFNESILPSQEECGVIEPLTSRRKYCGEYFESGWQAVTEYLNIT